MDILFGFIAGVLVVLVLVAVVVIKLYVKFLNRYL